MHLPMQAIWGDIWTHALAKSQTIATNVTLHPLMQALWGDISKRTAEKSQTNATNVTLHPFRQAIWGDTWECTVEKSQTNATNVTLHLLGHAIWGHTCYTCYFQRSWEKLPKWPTQFGEIFSPFFCLLEEILNPKGKWKKNSQKILAPFIPVKMAHWEKGC